MNDFLKRLKEKRILLELLEMFVILLYWELLLYHEIHGNLSGFGIWNFLFIVPLAFILTAFTNILNLNSENELLYRSL